MSIGNKKKSGGINKKGLTEQFAIHANIPKVRAAEYIDIFTNIIAKALQNGKKVTISDFGTFNLSERSAFEGYDPRNEVRIHVPRRIIPVFRAGKELKNSLNTPHIQECSLQGSNVISVAFNKIMDETDQRLLDPKSYSISSNNMSDFEILSVEVDQQKSESRKGQNKQSKTVTGAASVKLNCKQDLEEGDYTIIINSKLHDIDGNSTSSSLQWPTVK